MTASLEPYRRGRPLCPPGSDLKETLAYPNGDVVRWEYEPHRDLLTLVSKAKHSSYRYTYDAAGRRVSKNDERYGYNVLGELVLATNVVDGTVFAYAYDDIGNRLWSHEFGTNCTYVVNELNQYTNIVRGGVAEHPTFDADGNQTDIVTETGRWRVEYNGENRPVRWTRPADGMVLEMAYDSRGRRVRFNADTFVYDGYLNVGTTVWDPTEPIATRPLTWLSGSGPAYYFHDGNKNVTDVASSEGATRYFYAPFGQSRTAETVACDSPYRFSAEAHDRDLELTYYNYRHYSFNDGRWMVRDMCLKPSLNLFLFVQNDVPFDFDVLGFYAHSGAVYENDNRDGLLNELAEAIKKAADCARTLWNWKPGTSRGGTNDKFRHCLASCEISRDCGEDIAEGVGWAKEFRDLLFGYYEELAESKGYSDISNWLHSRFQGGEIPDSIEDFIANSQGLSAAKRGENCECSCNSAYPSNEHNTFQNGGLILLY